MRISKIWFSQCALVKIGFLAMIMVLALGQAGFAQSVQSLGDFKAWSAYSTVKSATNLCFVHSKPVEVDPQLENMGDPYFYVTHRPNEGVRYEINIVAGFNFQTDSLAAAQIGGQSYSLFTQGDSAWLEDVSQSADMAAAMRRGSTMVVEGIDERGTKVRLVFSLSGATASMRAIDNACG
ncbi:invasion associated locus B family protein [Maritalea sp. S77]|uniref:invasion associated locus B family protein n=1 Tax=Maritalea sp. S77 TaxID=3415125 RepID=UPI003C79CC10